MYSDPIKARHRVLYERQHKADKKLELCISSCLPPQQSWALFCTAESLQYILGEMAQSENFCRKNLFPALLGSVIVWPCEPVPTTGSGVGHFRKTKNAAFKATVFRAGWPLVWSPATRACGCPVFQSSSGKGCLREQELSVLSGKKTMALSWTRISKTIQIPFYKQTHEWTWWTVKPLVWKPEIFMWYLSTKNSMKASISQVNKNRVLKQTLSFKKLEEPKLSSVYFHLLKESWSYEQNNNL